MQINLIPEEQVNMTLIFHCHTIGFIRLGDSVFLIGRIAFFFPLDCTGRPKFHHQLLIQYFQNDGSFQ
jgi:hypothetical protein